MENVLAQVDRGSCYSDTRNDKLNCFEGDKKGAIEEIKKFQALNYPQEQNAAGKSYMDLQQRSLDDTVSAQAYLDEALGYKQIAELKQAYEGVPADFTAEKHIEELAPGGLRIVFIAEEKKLRIVFTDQKNDARTYVLKKGLKSVPVEFSRIGNTVAGEVEMKDIPDADNANIRDLFLDAWINAPKLTLVASDAKANLETFQVSELLLENGPNDLFSSRKEPTPSIRSFSVVFDPNSPNPLQVDYMHTPKELRGGRDLQARLEVNNKLEVINNEEVNTGVVAGPFLLGLKPSATKTVQITRDQVATAVQFVILDESGKDVVAKYMPDKITYVIAKKTHAGKCKTCTADDSVEGDKCAQAECLAIGDCNWVEDKSLLSRQNIWINMKLSSAAPSGFCYEKKVPTYGACDSWVKQGDADAQKILCESIGSNCVFESHIDGNTCTEKILPDAAVSGIPADYNAQLEAFDCKDELKTLGSAAIIKQRIIKGNDDVSYVDVVKKASLNPYEQAILLGIMAGESSANAKVLDGRENLAGAAGLMQFIKTSAAGTCFEKDTMIIDCPADLEKKGKCCVCTSKECSPDGRLIPEVAIPGAQNLLKQKERAVSHCKGITYTLDPEDVKIAGIAAYNDGEGRMCDAIKRAVNKIGSRITWADIHPEIKAHETRCYVPKILAFANMYGDLVGYTPAGQKGVLPKSELLTTSYVLDITDPSVTGHAGGRITVQFDPKLGGWVWNKGDKALPRWSPNKDGVNDVMLNLFVQLRQLNNDESAFDKGMKSILQYKTYDNLVLVINTDGGEVSYEKKDFESKAEEIITKARKSVTRDIDRIIRVDPENTHVIWDLKSEKGNLAAVAEKLPKDQIQMNDVVKDFDYDALISNKIKLAPVKKNYLGHYIVVANKGDQAEVAILSWVEMREVGEKDKRMNIPFYQADKVVQTEYNKKIQLSVEDKVYNILVYPKREIVLPQKDWAHRIIDLNQLKDYGRFEKLTGDHVEITPPSYDSYDEFTKGLGNVYIAPSLEADYIGHYLLITEISSTGIKARQLLPKELLEIGIQHYKTQLQDQETTLKFNTPVVFDFFGEKYTVTVEKDSQNNIHLSIS